MMKPAMLSGVLFATLALGILPFSISAGVGFIALFAVGVLKGVVIVSYITQLREDWRAVATSAGAEVQRPLATVVIGGLMTSMALTLLILPMLYQWFERESPAVQP